MLSVSFPPLAAQSCLGQPSPVLSRAPLGSAERESAKKSTTSETASAERESAERSTTSETASAERESQKQVSSIPVAAHTPQLQPASFLNPGSSMSV